MEPLVACSLACIPMLRPVTERLATSSIVSWTKSLVGGTSSSKSKNVTGGSSSSTSNSSRRHMAPKAGDHGYVETHSTEGLHQPSMPVTTAAATTHARASPDMEHGRPSSAERGIHVDYHIEQSDVEMQNVARGEKGDWNHGW